MKEVPTPGSHHQIICPNCGFAADHNYCAECGQETHLHKETFWGLVVHFIGHYFHYDSKFWMTMKALWFAPGRLTIDHWEGRRARHIPPISLYIFISAVYFICSFSIHYGHTRATTSSARSTISRIRQEADALDSAYDARDTFRVGGTAIMISKDTSKLERYFNGRLTKLRTPEGRKTVQAAFQRNFPKIFFFMIPLMGMLLKLLFRRRKDLYFVNHAIFSLHIHSLFFSVLLIEVLNPFYQIAGVLSFLCAGSCLAYFIIAMRKVYDIGLGKAIRKTVLVGIGYFLFFSIAWFATAVYILYTV